MAGIVATAPVLIAFPRLLYCSLLLSLLPISRLQYNNSYTASRVYLDLLLLQNAVSKRGSNSFVHRVFLASHRFESQAHNLKVPGSNPGPATNF